VGFTEKNKPRGALCALSIVAIPVLYFLSVSPIHECYKKTNPSSHSLPEWLIVYEKPWAWIVDDHPSIGRSLIAYDSWWHETLRPWEPW
jgi:hypothetical protein